MKKSETRIEVRMKKIASMILIILLMGLLSACALGGESKAPERRLSPADWPTAAPTNPPAAPTPFPKAGLSPAAENIAAATATPFEPAAQTAPTATPLPAPTQPAVTGRVTSYGLNVRRNPDAGADILLELRLDDEVTVLAVDEATGWLNVRAAGGAVGWVHPNFVALQDDLSALEGNTPQAAAPQPGAAHTGGTLLIQLRSGGDIMLVNRDGSDLRRLTTGIDPVLSPDGSQVAFTRWDGANQGTVWVINTDGTDEHPVVDGIRQVKSPGWSPDSRRIAVNFQEGGTLEATRHCWDVSRGEPDINFWQAYDIKTEVRFDAQGRPIIFVCWWMPPDAHWKLRIIEVDSGDYEDMPAGQYAFGPTWDPANPWRVVSAAGNGLVWTDVNRGVADSLTTDPSDRAPVFSPDGRFLAVTYRQDTHWEVHRLNADGTGRIRLTKTPLYAIVDGPEQWNNVSPVFSPDSREIAFLTDRAGRWEVWVMNVDGSTQRPMFSDALNDQLTIEYAGMDERALGWGQ